jgi:bifunctional ADP-heptose synthase (sugar kinase/adenylyltransferase)
VSAAPLDTRRKIVTPEDINRSQPIVLVSGYFDPLLASHAGRLEALRLDGRWLAVLLSDPPNPVLPLRARAELVAALRAVDYVLVADGDATHHNSQSEILHRVQPEEIVREEEADERRTRELIAHVRARQSA